MRTKSPVIGAEALKASNYREFLLAVLRAGQLNIPRGSLSALARRSGLSKSFLTEVLRSKKGLSSRSLAKLSACFRLQGDHKRYFETLVARDERELREQVGLISDEDVAERLQYLRTRLLQKHDLGLQQSRWRRRSAKSFLSQDVFYVYAALGSTQKGTTMLEVSRKTNLDPVVVMRVLETLLAADWVRRQDDTYFASERAFDLQEIGEDIGFVQAFIESTKELSRKAEQLASAPDSLIFLSVVPVPENRLAEFKSRLRSMVLDVLDEFQDDSTDSTQLKKVVLGMH